MTTSIPGTPFADPAPRSTWRAAAALTAHGFTVELLDDVAAARARVEELIPEGASELTGASETLRLSGIDADVNAGGRYQTTKPRLWPWTAPRRPTTFGGWAPPRTSSKAACTRSPKPAPS